MAMRIKHAFSVAEMCLKYNKKPEEVIGLIDETMKAYNKFAKKQQAKKENEGKD